MNRDQLDAANTKAIKWHFRQLADNGGQPSRQLLDDLAAIADQHAETAMKDAAIMVPSTPVLPPAALIPAGTEHAASPQTSAPKTPRTAPRRTTATRRSTK